MIKRCLLKNGDELVIRPTLPDDAPEILNYLQVIGGETDYLSFGLGEFAYTEEEEREILRNFAESDNQLHIFASLNDEIVSVLDVTASSKARMKHSGEFGLSVRKAHWGKGIGSEMIEYMISWAKSTKIIKKLNLKVASNNEKAINLYRKFEFSMEGRLTKEFYVNNSYYDMIAMGYWLES